MISIVTRKQASEDARLKVLRGTHVVVPVDLLRTLSYAGLVSYGPAWGGDEKPGVDAGRAAENILSRHEKLT